MRIRPILSPLLVLSVLAAGCGDDGPTADPDPSADLSGRVTVLAASSLTDAFTAVAAAFEEAHDGIDVELSFDASSALVTQIQEGAPADVFASADQSNLDEVIDSGDSTGEAVEFATNRLQIVVARGNPHGIDGLEDLSGDLRLALCAPEVPCGTYSARAFEKAGLPVPAASEEENVRGVLTKVRLGEADAGIVYVTDARASDDVERIDLSPEHQAPATYPAVVLAEAPNPDAAAAFVEFLTGADAREILASFGFGTP